jgi:hypothetical protein
MKGFMRRRGDAWELRVYLGADAVTRKQRYASRTIRAGKRELAKMIVAVEGGEVARTTTTVGELLDAWIEQASRDFSPKTVLESRGFIERSIKPALGQMPLSKLRTADIDRFYVRLQAPGGGKNGGALAPGTVRRIHGILRRALAASTLRLRPPMTAPAVSSRRPTPTGRSPRSPSTPPSATRRRSPVAGSTPQPSRTPAAASR